jgi:predicted  nucleic acid-binding Zn-ribbon protein
MSAALGLFRLQQVDRQMDQSSARMAAIRSTLENDAEVQQALRQVDEARNKELQVQAQLRAAEELRQSQQIKIEQAEASLYGGGVHNPKELQDLQNDVASLKKHLATLEERQLESMLELEDAEKALQQAEDALQILQASRGDSHGKLIEEQKTLARAIERLQAERQAVVTDILAPSLQIYDNLRERRRGIAVAEVSDNSCAACGTRLTQALQQAAHSTSQLAYCPSCGRVLYAG